MRKTLAEVPGIGKIIVCESCDRIHLIYGRITLDLTREEFLDLSRMIQSAEKNPADKEPDGFSTGLRRNAEIPKLMIVH